MRGLRQAPGHREGPYLLACVPGGDEGADLGRHSSAALLLLPRLDHPGEHLRPVPADGGLRGCSVPGAVRDGELMAGRVLERCDHFSECGRFTWSTTGLCEQHRPGARRRQDENAVIRADHVAAARTWFERYCQDRRRRGIPAKGLPVEDLYEQEF